MTVLHVCESSFPTQDLADKMHNEHRTSLNEYLLHDVVEPLRNELAGRLAARLAHGRPEEAILEELAGGNYDLVVMGTHGRHGFSSVMLGNVAERVVRRSRCPVLTVRAVGFADAAAA